MLVQREIFKEIKKDLFQGKVIIITGARQVGKTTLCNEVLSKQDSVIYFNGDSIVDRNSLEEKDFKSLETLVGDNKYIFIDEAQKVRGIGNILKLLVDNFKKEKQVIATGSSSLNLLSNTEEPLTGRKYVYELFGFSIREIFSKPNTLDIEKSLPSLLVYGSYPEVYLSGEENKKRILVEITSSYLYKDILELEQVKNPSLLGKLLSAISLQLGSEVSLTELANLVNLDLKTVERYIDLLEKNYVVFRLPPYSTNRRKSLSKLNKIYFFDLGVRNALINNFNPLELRNDVGALWENFLILERLKLRKYKNIFASQYFWRTYDGAEIDLVEDRDGKLFGYEIKWGGKHTVPKKSWLKYPNSEYSLVNRNNYTEFLYELA